MASEASELESSNSKATNGVVLERSSTVGRVEVASHVVFERLKTVARVVEAGGVVQEHSKTGGRVVAAGCVAGERIKTDSRALAGCQVQKRIITLGGIAAGIASVRCRNNPESSRGRRKCKRTKRKRDENESGPRTENREK